ncbi:hypothetical protein E5357_07545 [Hominisplanchenecus murintestinalis]|uniref:Uncharacterized protein n=1 Tax=Hominisplanchenecus murintestinalis TaxID=2941517 RepID=A0AC61QZV1_9FIRM|nr:hypothetical protein [Hominisplanchenecus murintestinalis]TGX98809.1 hypothetical protein E5357_07545 [Hominisplanchenecus murintestinalis]
MAKPKVISLLKTDKANNLFLNAPILGRPTDIFVQCASYDLKLPVNVQETRVLDIFEETILRMLRLKQCSASELADIICLEKDLVNFIITRLLEKGLLEDKYTLSDAGKNQLDLQESLRKEVEYQTAKIFIANGCDVILPYIHFGDFISEDIVDFSWSKITLGFGSIGNQKRVTGACIREKKGERKMAILPQVTIKNAIKKYNRLANKRKRPSIVLAEEYGIESTRGENIYFHMQMAVQNGNSEELMVSDGFVLNIDEIFGYIKATNPDLVMNVQSKAVKMDMEGNQVEGSRQQVYNGKYPEVVRYCRDMEKYMHKISDESSLDDIKQTDEDKRQVIINCYGMLEWAFYYLSLKYPVSDSLLQLFKRQKTYENFETINNLAKKIGMGDLEGYQNLFNNFDGKKAEMIYQRVGDVTPTMKMALPLCIVEASERDDSEFRKLVVQDHTLVTFINRIGKMAADFRHDSTVKVENIRVEEIRDHAVRIITTILPDIQLKKEDISEKEHVSNEKKEDNSDKKDVSNERLRATVACEKALGNLLYFSLDEGVQADFRKISPDKNSTQLPAAYEYVQILYRILQTVFYEESIKNVDAKWLSKDECIKTNEEILGVKLPKSLVTVKNERYNAARKGFKATLGAHFLVLIPNLFDEVELLKGQDIVGVVSKILDYRKHANNISLMVSDQELADLREKVINIIKILGGYYNGK